MCCHGETSYYNAPAFNHHNFYKGDFMSKFWGTCDHQLATTLIKYMYHSRALSTMTAFHNTGNRAYTTTAVPIRVIAFICRKGVCPACFIIIPTTKKLTYPRTFNGLISNRREVIRTQRNGWTLIPVDMATRQLLQTCQFDRINK